MEDFEVKINPEQLIPSNTSLQEKLMEQQSLQKLIDLYRSQGDWFGASVSIKNTKTLTVEYICSGCGKIIVCKEEECSFDKNEIPPNKVQRKIDYLKDGLLCEKCFNIKMLKR